MTSEDVQQMATEMQQLQQSLAQLQNDYNQLKQRHSIKPAKPELFDGSFRKDATSVDAWLYQVEHYLQAAGVTEDAVKVEFAATHLRGTAEIWWHHLETLPDNAGKFPNWEQFVQAIGEQFRVVNQHRMARDKLAHLVQKVSVQEYANHFRVLAIQIKDLSEGEKLDRFVRGLKPHIRQQLAFHDPKTFKEAVEVAERLDSAMFLYRDHKGFKEKARMNNSQGSPTPMELGAVGMRTNSGTSAAERVLLQKQGRCFLCKEKGHLAKDCPMAMKKTAAVNMSRPGN